MSQRKRHEGQSFARGPGKRGGSAAAPAPLAVTEYVRSLDPDTVVERLGALKALEQLDAIIWMAEPELRAHLERQITAHPRWEAELYPTLVELGSLKAKAREEARSRANSILTVLETRGLPVAAMLRDRILGCTDFGTLDRWLRSAVLAPTAAAAVR